MLFALLAGGTSAWSQNLDSHSAETDPRLDRNRVTVLSEDLDRVDLDGEGEQDSVEILPEL
ncbi:MAG: hypothetical protein KDL87_15665, partial [Verrucomicrobiae bacterium]|nr:hypothetical protein [Verrucomicrobiae bacterium]